MIQALIFDFDGLILDTETVLYQSWQEIYQEYYCTLALEKWLLRVGSSIDLFDAHIHLGRFRTWHQSSTMCGYFLHRHS